MSSGKTWDEDERKWVKTSLLQDAEILGMTEEDYQVTVLVCLHIRSIVYIPIHAHTHTHSHTYIHTHTHALVLLYFRHSWMRNRE